MIPFGCDPAAWTQLGVTWRRQEGEAIEDFYASPSVLGQWRAYFVLGPDFQHQSLMTACADGPMGPWRDIKAMAAAESPHPHQRLYRGAMGPDGMLITAAWPYAGKLGLWHFRHFTHRLLVKTLVLETHPPFDVVAANPAVLPLSADRYLVMFEGRSVAPQWTLYAFHWRMGELAQPGEVHTLWPGANPSLVRVGSEVYLFYSDREFNVRVAKMEESPA